MSATATATRVTLRTACRLGECSEFAFPLYRQLRDGRYEECSVLPLTESRRFGATALRRARQAERHGYRFEMVNRPDHVDDIYDINTSLEERQGRPMSAGYRVRPQFGQEKWPCHLHGVHPYGVFKGDTLVAYTWVYRAGELALVSSILGHGDHLANDVMYLLGRDAIRAEAAYGGFMVYNRHDSGTDGLRYYKERLGFQPMAVEWAP